MILSATEYNVYADMVRLKAALLYSGDATLASSRLYHTLIAMRASRKYRTVCESNDYVLAVEKEIGLLDDGALGKEIINIPEPDERSVTAILEVAKGFHLGAFSISPYSGVIKTLIAFMCDNVDIVNCTPVFDKETFDRLAGLTRVSLKQARLDAPGFLAKAEDRALVRGPLLASEILGRMPGLPVGEWEQLLDAREELAEVSQRMLNIMANQEYSDRADNLQDMAGSARYWWRAHEADIADVGRQFATVKKNKLRQIFASSIPQSVVGIGVAVAGLVEHHPALANVGLGMGVGGAAAGTASTVLNLADKQKSSECKVKNLPYWFIYRAADLWQPPSWEEDNYLTRPWRN